MLRLTLTVALFQLFLMAPAFAQYTVGQACGGAGQPEAGSFHTKNDATTKTVTQMMCNGTTWRDVSRYVPAPSLMFRSYSHALVDVAIGTGVDTLSTIVNKSNDYEGDVFIGYRAGGSSYTANGNNVVIGGRTGSSMGDSAYNTMIGAMAGAGLVDGFANTLIGATAGGNITWGNYNIIIGYGANAPTPTIERHLNIGNVLYGNLLGSATNDTGTAKIGINKRAPSVALDVIGDINFTGVMNDVSDIRQKEDIRSLANVLERLQSVHGVSFVMKNDPTRTREIGLIAQDVEKVFPGLVKTYNGVKSLNYQGMIGPLVEAVKELDTRNQTLNAENAELKQMIHALSARMDVIEGKARPRLSPLNR